MFKHKQGFVENEVSRRYVTDEPDFYEPQWRFKPEDNAKQGSFGFVEGGDQVTSSIIYARAIWNATKTYNGLIARGIAPEQARFVLPQGMYTEWYWTGSLAAFARFYKLRSDPHAQWEIQQYAEAISEIIEPLFPVSWKHLTAE
jgi:thymidylate synthase (FAD)